MDRSKDEFSVLVEKYLNNQLSHEEYRAFWRLLNEYPEERLDASLQQLWKEAETAQPLLTATVWDEGLQRAGGRMAEAMSTDRKSRSMLFFSRYRWVAAAVFLFLFISAIFFFQNLEAPEGMVQGGAYQEDVLPGGDRARLTLSDGTIILLDSAGNGMLAKQGTAEVIKTKDGQLVYAGADEPVGEVVYNVLQTPRGGQYAITLPDDSKVWLNAASSLRYPVVFGKKERVVSISGEAYFEIARDERRPFKVEVNGMEVEVLGTQFNINSYGDEESIRTTLFEGKVGVRAFGMRRQLNPGQQIQVRPSGNLSIVDDANLEETIAWKDGYFQFEKSDIQSVMRQLSRWYDVEVRYEGVVSKHFIGGISRNVRLSQVLMMLEQTGEVKFKIEGHKIIVMP
jgi:ferric-dicitrate binding protein FerR (iron transport regulator)